MPSSRPGARPGPGSKPWCAVEGRRWAIEDAFETAKTELGLAHNETRSWHGWHRHVSLVMLAFALMAAVRHRANQPPPPKTKKGLAKPRSDPLVGSGDPACGDALGPAAHPARSRHRLVGVAPRSPGRRTRRSHQTKIATVVLGGATANQARRMGNRPKWPMSAYIASPPVTAKNTAPSTAKLTFRGVCRTKPTA